MKTTGRNTGYSVVIFSLAPHRKDVCISDREIFKKIFLMWTFFKVSIDFVTILLHFMFWFFGPEAYGILAP